MQDDKPGKWQSLKKTSLNKKNLSRHVRRVESVTIRHARRFIVRRWNNAREVRFHIVAWIVVMGLLIGAIGLQLIWYRYNYQTTTVANNGTYAEAVLGPVDTLNPIFASTDAENSASRLLFSSLFSYDTSGHLNNDLAVNSKIEQDGKVYTIAIRPDALWHDGQKVTARDVAFTIGLLKNPAVHSTNPEDWSSISVEVINDTTLKFTLPAIIATFPYALTFPILPEHILGKVEPNKIRENDFGRSPIGSGSLKFRFVQEVDVNAGHKIVYLTHNVDYYRGASRLEFFQLHVYNTHESIVHALTTYEVNAAAGLSATDLDLIKGDRYDQETTPIKSGVYALLNTKGDILKDKIVRQALQLGTDTNELRKRLPAGTPALDLPFIDGQLSGDVPKVAKFDLNAAQSLLDSAGWKLDNGVRKKGKAELRLTVVTIKDSDYERVLETLIEQWRKLGIVADTKVVDPSDASQRVVQDILQPRNYDVLLYQLTIGADPDVYAYWHSSQASLGGVNFSNYSNPISDDALVSARSRLEPELRNLKYLKFASQWISDVPAIGLYQSTVHYVHNKGASAYDSSNVLVSPIDRYADILHWSVGSRSVYKTP